MAIAETATKASEFQSCKVFSSGQVLFPDITYGAFIYPGDEEAIAAMRRIPGAAKLLTYLQEHFTEQLVFVENNEHMIRVSAKSFSSLYKLVERCAAILSCPVPEVYLTNAPGMNAYTIGHRRTNIVLHSSLIEAMTPDEIAFVVGHEIGHIKCGHGLYRQLGDILLRYWEAACSSIPVPGLGLLRIPLLLAYWEWYRRAEFTCDRAGLLCLQDPGPALTGLGKLAGKVRGFEDEFDVEATIAQCEAHEEVNKLVKIVAIMANAGNTHPFIPLRLKQVREYFSSDSYKQALLGKYPRDPLGLHEGGKRIQCPCGAVMNSKIKFCCECGRSTEAEQPGSERTAQLFCESCGSAVTTGMKFCTTCGVKQRA